jgi:hypothetical protein
MRPGLDRVPKMLFSRVGLVVPLVLASLVVGCGVTTLRGGFEPGPESPSGEGQIARLEVSGLADARPLAGRSRVGPGFLALIPLVPYGHQQFSPESAQMTGTLTTESMLSELVDVVVRDLQRAGLSSEVSKGGLGLQDLGEGRTEAAAHQLRLTLDEGIYHRNQTLYGVSLAGALLWIVGLPSSYGSAELAFTAELVDPGGRSLGSRRFRESSRATEWLYRPLPIAYSPAMPRAYGEISPELRRFVAEAAKR